jgi:peptidylprolyl isomerase
MVWLDIRARRWYKGWSRTTHFKETPVKRNFIAIALTAGCLLMATTMVSYGQKAVSTASGLKIEILKEGTGPLPQPGQTVVVHYTGTLEDGKEFDSSRKHGEPISLVLGAGEVIPGWDQGLAMITVGTRAKLTIPPQLGYGSRGMPGLIPPNATLIFDVELISAK